MRAQCETRAPKARGRTRSTGAKRQRNRPRHRGCSQPYFWVLSSYSEKEKDNGVSARTFPVPSLCHCVIMEKEKTQQLTTRSDQRSSRDPEEISAGRFWMSEREAVWQLEQTRELAGSAIRGRSASNATQGRAACNAKVSSPRDGDLYKAGSLPREPARRMCAAGGSASPGGWPTLHWRIWRRVLPNRCRVLALFTHVHHRPALRAERLVLLNWACRGPKHCPVVRISNL